MRAKAIAMLSLVALSACSGGSSNPFGSLGSIGSLNPFGGRDEAPARSSDGMPVAPADGSVLVERLETVRPEPALRGVIIRASGIASTQGYFGARLAPVNGGLPDEAGVVTYEFRVLPPETVEPTGTDTQRRLIVATFVPDADLAEVRGFRVVARTNSVDLRR
ncbi:hypothetical protein HMH01_09190 [Halovulum dunhuangense]|uniref:Lipoprotein n=1 Tax=Halovulum dunhuangense TaxID=1505036 RepID=A0A849L2N1_9RHOB|nr:hypothetical protein [Halovulum dunhuangense]NNU80608.1 hypothetical protein [Halovulum dunhuangense]